MSAKITVIVYILICFEVGILLLFLPWTPYWDDNIFLSLLTGKLDAPWIRIFLTSGYIKGAVSGLGALNIIAGFLDVFRFRESVQALIVLGEAKKEEAKSTIAESSRQSSIGLPDQQPPSAPPQP